jgi:hypothetical protein
MLGRRAEDARIMWEIPLRERGHHAPRARANDAQAYVIPDGEGVADSGILRKAHLP